MRAYVQYNLAALFITVMMMTLDSCGPLLQYNTHLSVSYHRETSRPREEYGDRISENLQANQTGQFNNLTILHAVDEDVGIYSCYDIAQSSTMVDVIVAPLILNMIDQIAENFLRIKCNVTAYPNATVSWNIVYKETSLENHTELHLSESTGRWTLSDFNNVANAELFVDNLTPYDTGTYVCLASNIVETVSSNRTIEITATPIALTVALSVTGGILAFGALTVTVKSATVKAALTNVYNSVMGKSATSVRQPPKPPTRGADTFNVVNENPNQMTNQTNAQQQNTSENPTQEEQTTEQQGEEEDVEEEEGDEDVEEEEYVEGDEAVEGGEEYEEVEEDNIIDIVQDKTKIRIDFDEEYRTINLIAEIILLTILNIRALMQIDAPIINYKIFFNLKETFKTFSPVVQINYKLQNITLRKVFLLLTPDFSIGRLRKGKKEKDLVSKCYEFFNSTLQKKQSIHNSTFINSLLPLTVDECEIIWCTTHSKDKLTFEVTEKSVVDPILVNIFQNTGNFFAVQNLSDYLEKNSYSLDINPFAQRFNILCNFPKENVRSFLIQQKLGDQCQGNPDKILDESRNKIKALLKSKKEGYIDETNNILRF